MWPFKKREPFHQIKKTAAALGDAPVDYFMSAGLDFKGQTQMGYQAAGYGLGADFALDAGKLVGFVELGVGASVAVNRASGVMLVAQRGADRLITSDGAGVELRRPLCLSSLMGVLWEANVGVSLDVGIGIEASAGVSLGSQGLEAESKLKHSFKEDEEEEPALAVEAAAIGVSLEGKAGFGASASYTYQNLYLEDVTPQYYGDGERARLRSDLEQLFKHGSDKKWVKEGACQFLTANAGLGFKAMKYEGWFTNTGSKDIFAELVKGCEALRRKPSRTAAEEAALTEGDNWIARVRPYAGGQVSTGLTRLHLTSHSPSGEAGFRASLELSAGAGTLGELKAGASVQGPSLAVAGKRAAFRFQTAWGAGARVFLTTQDTVVTYASFGGALVGGKVEASASSGAANRQKTVEAAGQRVEFALQRMSYVSATVTWEQPDPAQVQAGAKVAALQGSGFAFGQSCVAASLARKIGKVKSGRPPGKYLDNLARALRVPVATLVEFLSLPDVAGMIGDVAAVKEAARQAADAAAARLTPEQQAARRQQIEAWTGGGLESPALLIEAVFAAPADFRAPLAVKRDGKGARCELGSDARAQLLAHADVKDDARRLGLLQSLRVRWRIQDEKTRDADAFALGFKVLGQELSVKLARVDRASSEGIVDLAIVWVQGGKLLPEVNTAQAFNVGVPGVTLFCQ